MTTVPFLPQVGGMEVVVHLLARSLTALGCVVKVVTATPSINTFLGPYEVIRQPSLRLLWRLYTSADVYVQHGPALQFGWTTFFGRKPSLIVHHNSPPPVASESRLSALLRFALLRQATSCAVSEALAASLPLPEPFQVMLNPFDDVTFQLSPGAVRDGDLIFVGRLEPLKGVVDLIDAIKLLEADGLQPGLTIVGEGSQMDELRALVATAGLNQSVHFTGMLSSVEVAKLLNRHKILVVPSRFDEPFGLVALEGIACGCVVVGSNGGGLPEAIGPCGKTFRNGDAVGLANAIRDLLSSPAQIAAYRDGASEHLFKHRPDVVAKKYINLLGAIAGFQQRDAKAQ